MTKLSFASRVIAAAILTVTPVVVQASEVGRQVFRDYCVTCHGMEGRGDGPMTQVLTIQPPDITRLSADNDGVFPISRVVAQIDGRVPVLGHGGPMPIFGPVFEGQAGALDSETGTPILTSETMVEVVEYLKSLQR
ncbi:c-type cytochrome [Tropicimonas sp. S265A]|uniref:c-type cytochrome n=1 Tax=Tropicimonas sp. S265A TaxID=3415134 RepID=UPI003C7BE1DD